MTLGTLVLSGTLLVAGPGEDSLHTRDTLSQTLVPADSNARRADSLVRYHPLEFVGTMDPQIDPLRTLPGDQFPRLDVRYLGDALSLFPGIYVRDQQSPGQYNQINAGGVDWRGAAVLMDGRRLNDPASGSFNLFFFPPENVDRLECITGAEAFLYGLNSTGAAVNLVTRDFDSNIPRTKLHLSVSSYSFESSDASFHQNVSRRMNISFGLRAQNTEGRFPNSGLNAWNLRGKVRFHILPNLTLYLSEHYTSTRLGLFGGVDLDRTASREAFSPILATTVNAYAYDKLTRHDLTATLAGRVFDDSSAATRLTFYYSGSLREYRDGEPGIYGLRETTRDDQRTSWFGATANQQLRIGTHSLLAGVTLEEEQIEGSPQLGRQKIPVGAVWLKDRIGFGTLLELSLFGRADRFGDHHGLGAGTTLAFHPSTAVTIFAGLSRSHRLPTALELYWSDSTISRPSGVFHEIHTIAEAGATLETGIGTVELTVYRREVRRPILLEPFGGLSGLRIINGGSYAVNGVDARVALRFWVLALEGTGSYTRFSTADTRDRYPWIFGQGGLYFEYPLFEGHLDIKTGVRGTGQVGQTGERFNAQRLSYSRNIGSPTGTGAKIDLVLLARIGSADIHFIWENVTGAEYFGTPYFPVMDRQVRFGVAWGFIN